MLRAGLPGNSLMVVSGEVCIYDYRTDVLLLQEENFGKAAGAYFDADGRNDGTFNIHFGNLDAMMCRRRRRTGRGWRAQKKSMIYWIDLTNYGIAVDGLMVVLLGLLMSIFSRYQEKWDRRFFVILFSFLISYVSSDLLSQISLVLLGPSAAPLSRIAIFGESLLSSLLMPMLTVYLIHCTGEDWHRNMLLTIVGVLWLGYFVLLIVTQFTTVIYTVTPDNVYRRGAGYPVLLIAPVLLMLLNLLALWRRRTKLTRQQTLAFALYLLIPMDCMIVQMLSYGLLMIVIGSCVAAFCMFLFILRDQQEHYAAQQEENARQKASIMVLQMRPHFIYNTLMSIYSLCSLNPQKAKQVTMDFTDYLRRNFNAVANGNTIPFSAELEHTRTYLAVEQALHEEMLLVEYDTQFTWFRLPPLTLQPIAENAVKHGMNPYAGPLRVTVRTYRIDSAGVIIVEDDGTGFGTAEMNESHMTLTNIRQRLELMCGGRLEITPRDGGGTVVTVTIPLRNA